MDSVHLKNKTKKDIISFPIQVHFGLQHSLLSVSRPTPGLPTLPQWSHKGQSDPTDSWAWKGWWVTGWREVADPHILHECCAWAQVRVPPGLCIMQEALKMLRGDSHDLQSHTGQKGAPLFQGGVPWYSPAQSPQNRPWCGWSAGGRLEMAIGWWNDWSRKYCIRG